MKIINSLYSANTWYLFQFVIPAGLKRESIGFTGFLLLQE